MRFHCVVFYNFDGIVWAEKNARNMDSGDNFWEESNVKGYNFDDDEVNGLPDFLNFGLCL